MSVLVLGFAGTREEVDWQVELAMTLGISEPTTLDYQSQFWSVAGTAPRTISVLPSRLIETVRSLGNKQFVARAGNGVIYHRGDLACEKVELPQKLMQRVKETFDPKRVLPDIPA